MAQQFPLRKKKNKRKVLHSLWASLFNWFGTSWWVIPGAPSLQGAERTTSATIPAPPKLWQGTQATFWTFIFPMVLWGEVVAQSFQLMFDCSCSCFPVVAVTPVPSAAVTRRMTVPLESSLENEFGDSWVKLAQSRPRGTQQRVGYSLPWRGQSQWCANTRVDLVHKLSYPCNCRCIAVLLPWDDKAPWLGGLKIFVWTDEPMLLLSRQGEWRGGGVL